jgi:PAS domain S-box-containing protein
VDGAPDPPSGRRPAGRRRNALDCLRRLTATLETATDLETLARAVADEVAGRDAGAGAVLGAIGADGMLRFVAATYPTDVVATYDGLPVSSTFPMGDAMLRGEAVWIRTRDEVLRRYPAVQTSDVRSQASAALPLRVDGATIGGLGVTFSEPNAFDDEERALLLSVAGFCALVLSRRLSADAAALGDEPPKSVGEAPPHTEDVATGGASRAAVERTIRITTTRLETLMRDAPVGFAFVDRDLRFQLVNDKLAEIHGVPVAEHIGRSVDEIVPDLAEINAALFERVLAGEPVLETEVRAVTRAEPEQRRDWLVNYYPVYAPSGTVIGIGATVVDVTERNQLLRAARTAAARASELQRFAAAMARAATVDAVVRVVVDMGATAVDADVVNVVMRLHGENKLRIYHSTDVAPSAQAWPTVAIGDAMPIAETLRENRARYFGDREAFVAAYPNLARNILAAGMNAVATLPLSSSDGTTIGGMAFAFAAPQPFDAVQRLRLQTVVDIAAQSLDRARLYERERDVARTLQVALLPAALPVIDNVAIEARYFAGGADVAVGGDWYDVLRFGDGRIGLVIGDAAGRGIDAATFMGKARHAAAALAIEHRSPAEVLRRVNEYLCTVSSRRSMATCCYVVLDPEAGRLRFASAGHLPPVVSSATETRFLEGARSVPLGVVPDAAYIEAEVTLEEPSTLLLYTDGLVERRGEPIDVGLDRLRATVAGLGCDPADLCRGVAEALLPSGCDDDAALLAASFTPSMSASKLRIRLRADAEHLADMRRRVGDWLGRSGVDDSTVGEIVLAVNEAATNSALHAYAQSDVPGDVEIALALEADELVATVTDRGEWQSRPPSHDGLGLILIHLVMADVAVERSDRGTLVRMRRALN